MEKRTKRMLIAMGCLLYIIVCPIIIYFGSTCIACIFSTKPFNISIVLGIIIALITGILLYYFRPIRRWLILCLLPIATAVAASEFIDEFLPRHKAYRNGYIKDASYYDRYYTMDADGKQRHVSVYKYYDIFGREVFKGTEEEWEMYHE